MCRKIFIILSSLICLACSNNTSSITSVCKVNIKFPSQANSSYTVVTYHGTRSEITVYGQTDAKGRSDIDFPDDYRGVATLYCNEKEVLNMVLSGESFSVSEQNGSIHFSDNDNNLLVNYFNQRMSSVKSKNNSYAERLIRIFSFLQNVAAARTMNDIIPLRSYLSSELSADDLYNSGVWDDVVSSISNLYANNSTEFGLVILNVLSRTARDEAYQQLIKSSVIYCERMGWDKAERLLLDSFLEYSQIKPPVKEMERIYNLALLKKGSNAPHLSQGKLPKKKTIIFFYESGCGNCSQEFAGLTASYENLRMKGYEVVSIASDMDRDIFEKAAKTFPWKAVYCDLQGMDGADFVNYGIMGTPTIYMVDENGRIQGRYAKLEDMRLQ